jgi:hypothetical protein
MASTFTPRLHRDRFPIRFWGAACLIAFVLSFGMGSVWADRRATQEIWAATYNR